MDDPITVRSIPQSIPPMSADQDPPANLLDNRDNVVVPTALTVGNLGGRAGAE
ncbi:hypothetical protein [Streptomyces hyaluromycini]|uniref:hypothetical protein n=1 Tax=Streptomyces hyaluromycini TaxID=1377993 RepID=UPI00142D98F4|nr:hypothetical protein [Streptomyces hyaluromycini]